MSLTKDMIKKIQTHKIIVDQNFQQVNDRISALSNKIT